MLAETSRFFPVENVQSEHLQRDYRHRLHGNADLVEVEWAPGEERATRWRKRFREETAWMTAEEAAARAAVVGGEGAAAAF